MALTKEQFTQLYNKGLSVDQIRAFEAGKKPEDIKREQQIQQPQDKGFLRTLIEDPFKTLLVKPAARTAEAVGRTGLLGENIKRGYEAMSDAGESQTFGGITVEPQKAFGQGGASQILGDVAKTTSYLYSGGAGTQAVRTGLKGEVIAGTLQGAKTGAIGGGTASFGEAIQNAENSPSDVAYKTLLGTAGGAVTGGIIGATIPVVVNTIGKVKEYTDINKLTEKLYTQNKDILKPTSSQMSDWSRAKVDPLKTFTKEFGPEAIPTSGDKLELDNFINQVDTKYRAGSEGFNTILRNSPETVSLNGAYRKGLNDIEQSGLTPTLKEKALAKLNSEFDGILNEARQKGVLYGDDNIPAWYADNLKDRFWKVTKNFGSEEGTVANTVNKSIGFGFKEGIEGAVTDVNVKNYNKQLQELIYLKDFLESRNGKVPGTGGKMARYVARIIGGTAGTGGGPVGSVVGSITADKIAQAMINPNSQTWIIRKQLEKLSPEVRKSLQAEAEQIIADMAQRRASTLRLPAPDYIPMGANIKPDISGVVPGSSRNTLFEMQSRINTPSLPAPTAIYQPPLQGGLPYTPNQ